MTKRCRTIEHTADAGLAAEADSLAELFEALGEGLADYICPRGQVSAGQTRDVSVQAEDREALAVDFLWEVMSVVQGERFAVASVKVAGLDETSITAELAGEPYDPARHEIHTEVKAVTWHQLKIAEEAGRWVGRVILDL